MIETFQDVFLVTCLFLAGLWFTAVICLIVIAFILDMVNMIIPCPDSIRVVTAALEWIFLKG